jgi:hypothetical protein
MLLIEYMDRGYRMPTSHSPPPPPLDDGAAVYNALRNEINARIGLQNKCVELSIHITSALAAAIVALVAARSNIGSILEPVTLLIAFYGLVQSLILANYIYHTYFVLRIHTYIRDRMLPYVQDRAGLVMGHYEGSSLPQDVRAYGTMLGWAIFRFQSLPLYGSIGLAWVVVSALLLWPPTPFALSYWVSIPLILALWSELFLMFLVHTKAQAFALDYVLDGERKTIIP